MPEPDGDMPLTSRLLPASIRRSYGRKLVVAFAVVLVIIAGIGGIIFVQTSAQLQENTETQLTSTAESQAAALDQWEDRTRETVRLLSRSEALSTTDYESVDAFLSSEIESEGRLPPAVAAVHVMERTADGPVVRASTNQNFIGVNPAQEGVEWAQGGVSFESSDETKLVGPVEAPRTGAPVVAFLSPVPDSNRITVMMVSLEERSATLPGTGDDITTLVANGDGTVVLSEQQRDILTQHTGSGSQGSQSAALDRGLGGESGYTELSLNGTQTAVGFAPVAGTDWVVMTQLPTADAFALRQSISLNLLILLVAVAGALLLVGLTLGRNTLQSLTDLSEKTAEIEAGNFGVALQSTRTDEIGALYDSFGSMRDSLQETIEDAEDARENAESARAEVEAQKAEANRKREEVERILEHLEAKAQEYCTVMKDFADGDLTRRMNTDSDTEAMAEIAREFNGMADELEATMEDIQQFADRVVASSDAVTASASEIQTASQQVAESMQEISAGADEQSDKLRRASNETQNLSGTIEEVAASADEVASTAAETAEAGERGRDAAQAAISEMSQVEETTVETVTEVESLAQEIDEIGEIVELISDIAEQTNTLALNASIEAARAGEAGEGFAVVADEVKTLATEASEATKTIEEIIDEVQSATGTTVDDIRAMRDNVESGVETVEDAVDAFDEVAEGVEETNQGIQEISETTDEQASSTTEVATIVDEASDLAQTTSQEATSVSAAAEEQTAATNEVSENIESLSDRASDLHDLLAEFETTGHDHDGAAGSNAPLAGDD